MIRSVVICAGISLGLAAGLAGAKVLKAGPGERYAAPCAAIAAAGPGDVIEVDAGGSYDGDVCAWNTPRLTIRGVEGRAKIDAAGKNAQGKGIWVINGDDTVVENIEFSGARVADNNGAGIRLGGSGLTVRNCYFHDNQEGILGGTGGTVLIEYSEFARNGHPDGRAHNLYIGAVQRLIFRFNYSHDSITGHLLKSRAHENQILYNRLSSEDGDGSYEIDLPNGGLSYVIGNVVQQGAASVNGGIISFGLEGLHKTGPNSLLYVVNNTLVNERTGDALFLAFRKDLPVLPLVINNVFAGEGDLVRAGRAELINNVRLESPGFVDLAGIDYRPLASSPVIGQAIDPGSGSGQQLTPDHAYVHPACGVERKRAGELDLGAYEYDGYGKMTGPSDRCSELPSSEAIAVADAAVFTRGPTAPGAIISVFGGNLTDSTAWAQTIPLPSQAAGFSLELDGRPLPLFYVSPGQANAQLPIDILPGFHTLSVIVEGRPGPAAAMEIIPAAPQIFRTPDTGAAIAQNQDWSLNDARNPANPGEYVTIYVNGIGGVTNPVPEGAAAANSPLSRSALSHSITVGGATAEAAYLGLAPDFVAVAQATFAVPPVTAGSQEVVVTVDGVNSLPAAISVGN